MKSTRRLLAILFLLISLMAFYYTINNYEKVTSIVNNIVRKYSKNNVIVPKESYNHRVYLYKTVSETDNFEPHSIDDIKKIYYTVLNNGWDTFTFYCPYEYESCVDDVKMIANSTHDTFISLINNYVSPLNSYKRYNTVIIDDNKVVLTIEKLYTDEEIKELNNYLDEYFKVNSFNTTKATKKDIEKIHDFLINRITYDVNYEKTNEITDSNKATGALFNGIALCSGYSDAFGLFLDRINVPNFKINSDEHEWTMVYYDNEWKHIDITWDDDEVNKNNNRNFFLINTAELFKKDTEEHNFNNNTYLEIK